jgi:hypothetical protein
MGSPIRNQSIDNAPHSGIISSASLYLKNHGKFFLYTYVLMGCHVRLLIETQATPLIPYAPNAL